MKKNNRRLNFINYRRGIALAITLMVLVVLSVITATLAVRVAQVRRRQQYMMDYQKARYGLDSAMKYALAVLPEKKFPLVVRKDAPDFSDLFWLKREEYLSYVDAWAAGTEPELIKNYLKKSQDDESGVLEKQASQSVFSQLLSQYMGTDDEPNEPNSADVEDFMEYFDPNQVVVPGPYGPAWPNVIEPVKLEIGECQVTIAIEDENAKMPLSWLVTNNMAANKQARAALQTFAEWMGVSEDTTKELIDQLEKLSKEKMFKLSYSTVLLPAEKAASAKPAVQPQAATRTSARSRRRTMPQNTPQPQTPAQQKTRAQVAHAADFAKLFHSSMLNIEPLAVPQKDMAFENESAMKYMALWGSQRINVNTAPRQVLQAAFTFGGNPEDIADAVILARKEKPINTMEELKKALPSYSSSVDRAGPYIDTVSKFFSVRVTSRCGRAKVSSVATVIKEGKQMEKLMMLYGR